MYELHFKNQYGKKDILEPRDWEQMMMWLCHLCYCIGHQENFKRLSIKVVKRKKTNSTAGDEEQI